MARKSLLVTTMFALLAFSGAANAYSLGRTAKSGKPARMYQYGSWKDDCSSYGGVVKVISKPQHGTLMPVREVITITSSRFPRKTDCRGRQIQGFVVYYRSRPGFVGTDSFTIEVKYPSNPADVDTFTVQVQ